MVKDNGGSRLFAQPIMDAKPTTFEILGTVSYQGVFHFPNTRSLANFAEKVSIHYGHDSDLMRRLRLEIPVFYQCESSDLDTLCL